MNDNMIGGLILLLSGLYLTGRCIDMDIRGKDASGWAIIAFFLIVGACNKL